MIKNLSILLFLVPVITATSQTSSLPEAVTNNAVAVIKKNTGAIVYSFYGLDSTKKGNGIHKKVFRINYATGKSACIGEVPDSAGRIASAASVIHNKIYIAGGYTVYPTGKEKSSPHIFIFNPATEKFSNGADLIFPIDDHIQTVWRDSLLFIITGWNDSSNTAAVQVYNPLLNEWKLATPVPNETEAKVFGGCGIIVKDTIYYLGGAMFEKFYPPANILYKGVINPKNPFSIQWQHCGNFPGAFRYRSASFYDKGKIYFFGGSNETYNYNGISYKEKKGVNPNTTVLIYEIKHGKFSEKEIPLQQQRMDLRNIVSTGKNKFIIVGGMMKGQKVSNKAITLSLSSFR